VTRSELAVGQTVSLSFDLKGGNGLTSTYDFASLAVAATKITLPENIRAALQRRLRLRHVGNSPTAQQ
jgi:hypothetical protein